MIIYEKENNGFSSLVQFINQKYEEKALFDLVFAFAYENEIVLAKYDTMYETDNGLYDEPGYEEYNAIAFINEKTGELFETNYLNLPNSIMCGNQKII